MPEASAIVGHPLRDLHLRVKTEVDFTVVGIVRNERRILAPSRFEVVRAGDVLIVEADSEALQVLVDAVGLELAGSKELDREGLSSDEIGLFEVVVVPGTPVEGRIAMSLNLRQRFGMNLLAVSRQGERLRARLGRVRFRAGDVLLLQGNPMTFREVLSTLGFLPLQARELRIGQKRRLLLTVGIFAAAIVINIFGVLPAQVASPAPPWRSFS